MAAINRRFLNSECLPVEPFNIDVIDPVMIANTEAQCCFDLREITARWLDATLLSMFAVPCFYVILKRQPPQAAASSGGAQR